ncbi:hypothetical protein BST95_07910 [Halioglobus japonicus]|uniref:DUF521 domain-containing protein n=1 Tax=Halioglobus japonicus TaxID=930805 RepID=A0AAP8ME77_9GAMM|nr:aconitase X [Halioglobus japonicus]AQA18171.1 hypothetical protein BST95_07910 [Halioglobus japonicus]PLW86172.1 DUF521 domain-containing protein [Halioglobus japonicus]GHD14076.1 hypothetical protein GCM10007052_17370 [Halioglobus japonicus]
MPLALRTQDIALSSYDRDCLDGRWGSATARAMQFVVQTAKALQARRLIDVNHCHLVGPYYSGEADLTFLRRLVEDGARVRVPTTLNASSACLAHDSPSPPCDREAAASVVELYRAMGCDAQLTCAPYQLPGRPMLGDTLAWAESNAVVFANSVLGARTNKTVQYLDLCAALTGRIPEYGLYLDDMRQPTCIIDCSALPDETWRTPLAGELIGLWLGQHFGTEVPLLRGLSIKPSEDYLRGLGAAAASAGAISLFHVAGVTPEADQYPVSHLHSVQLTTEQLHTTAAPYQGTPTQTVNAVCLGTPHYSLDQLRALTKRMIATDTRATIPVFVTTSRYNRDQLHSELLAGELATRGVTLVVDACSYYRGVIPNPQGTVLTDSAKWAYYGSGNLNIATVLGDLNDCLATASSGHLQRLGDSPWL